MVKLYSVKLCIMCPYFSIPDIYLEGDDINVRKVSSGFEYFLLIFAIQLGQSLKVLGLDAEFNSASNGDIFEGGHWAKNGVLTPNTVFLSPCSASISC